MTLAHDIEKQIGSIMTYIMSIEKEFKLYETCLIFSMVLNHGGKKVTIDDVYEELGNAKYAEILPLVLEVLKKIYPMFFNEVGSKKKRVTKTGK